MPQSPSAVGWTVGQPPTAAGWTPVEEPKGWAPVATTAPTAGAEQAPPALLRAAQQFYEKSPLGAIGGVLSGAADVVQHPIDTLFGIVPVAHAVQGMARAQWDEAVTAAQKAKAFATGRGDALTGVEALGHGLAAILPILGPAAANVGEHGAQGDIAGMVGGAAGLLTPFAAKYGLEVKKSGSVIPTPAKVAAGASSVTKLDRLMRDANTQVSQRVLAPANPRYKPTATRIAPEVLERGLSGDRIALQQSAEQGLADAGAAIDQATVGAGGAALPIPTRPIIDALTNRIQEFQVNGSVIPTAVEKVAHLTKLRDYIKKLGPQAPLSDVLKIRDEFYATAEEAGGYAKKGDAGLGTVAWAAREAGSAIRQHLAALNPEAAAARADYTFWKSLNDVLDPDLGRPKSGAASAGVTGGRATVGAVAAQAIGTTQLGKAAAAVGLGKILPLIQDTVNSPAWQLAKAADKYKLAEAIRKGQPSVVQGVLYKIAALAPKGQSLPAMAAATAIPPDQQGQR